VEITEPGLRFLLAVIVLLRLDRQIVLQMPNRVRERAVLRREQQCRQHNLQQATLRYHLVMPAYGRQPFNSRELEHNPGAVAKAALMTVGECYILLGPVLPR